MHISRVVLALTVLAASCVAGAQERVTIPHAQPAYGEKDVAVAWLGEPTRRYGHGVLGDEIEAASLLVEGFDGRVRSVRLADRSVFEDLQPRIADIDNDGREEVWVVRSDDRVGARLEAYTIAGGELRRRYATAPIGTGYRWLNPVGVDDFDGDGKREAAYVQTPHIGGVLTIVQVDGTRLRTVARLHGVSNHAMGSTSLDLSAVANLDDRPGVDIVLPDQTRQRLVVVTLMGGQLVERWRSARGQSIAGGLSLRKRGVDWAANYRTPSGDLATVRIPTSQLR